MAKLGFERATPGSAHRCVTDCAMEPGKTLLILFSGDHLAWQDTCTNEVVVRLTPMQAES